MDTKTYLSALLTTIRDLQAARGADSVDVAYLGNVLRKDGKDWATHGFERLSAALAQLQQDNLAEVFRSEKDALRVRVSSGSAAPSLGEPASIATAVPVSPVQSGQFLPLRPPVWFAFAARLPDGQQRLLNRRTGMVWRDAAPPPATDLDWVLVVPIPEEEQRRWAEEFLKRPDIGENKEALSQAIQDPDWFRRFPSDLEKRGPLLVRAWSHLRSTRIIDHVKAWAKKNNVAEDLLFAAGRSAGRWAPVTSAPSKPIQDLRQALLGAVARMQTEDLLALPIPARLVIEVIRPDLLR